MKRFLIPAAILAAIVQTGLVGKMITDRAALLQGGTEVWLRTTFVDPRDLLRGHYVVLNLEIERIDTARVDGTQFDPKENRGYRPPVWISLEQGEDGFWQPRKLWAQRPEDASLTVIKGEFLGHNNRIYRIDFPFDQYFAPYERAQELEHLRQENKLGVVIALGPDGTGAIKGLVVDGVSVYDEPLF